MIEIIALVFTVSSLAFAIYQGSQRKRLESFIRSEAWYLYSKASNANGQYQLAMKKYKENHKSQLDPEFIELISKGDGFGQDLTRESVRLIQLSEPIFDKDKIEKWEKEGKVYSGHKKLFEILVVDNDKSRFWNNSSTPIDKS